MLNNQKMENMTQSEFEAAFVEDAAGLVRIAANMLCEVYAEPTKTEDGRVALVGRVSVYEPSHIDALNIHNEFVAAWGNDKLMWESERGCINWYIHIER